jgi:two-component system, OmpR family, sensor histidine kinase MprB
MTIRARLTTVAAISVALSIVLVSLILYLAVRAELRGQVDRSLQAASVGVLPPPAAAASGDRRLGGEITLPTSRGGVSALVQFVIAGRGGLEPPLFDLRRPTLPIDARARAVAAGRGRPFFRDANVRGLHVRIYTTRLPSGIGVELARSLGEVDRALARLRSIIIAVSSGGIALALALGFAITRSALRPIRRFTETTEHVAETYDLTPRVDVRSRGELGRLAASFNSMLAALESALTAQRQLVADASHELRTPLTSIRANLELLATANGLARGERERLLGIAVAELEELGTLVANLLELARDRTADDDFEDVQLDSLLDEAVARARLRAPRLTFVSDLAPSVVRGSPWRIEQAIVNLLDNAVKWSEEGGSIDVALDHGRISVRDHGPGVAEDDLPHIFERFYRASSARGLPGSGLGLAIVRQVAEEHGGRAYGGRPAGGGSLFVLDLSPSLLAEPGAHDGPAGALGRRTRLLNGLPAPGLDDL